MEGLKYLADNKIGKKFNGALLVPDKNITGSICQYGNPHISVKNKKADNLFKKAIDKTMFGYVDDNSCSNTYYKSSSIKDRKML